MSVGAADRTSAALARTGHVADIYILAQLERDLGVQVTVVAGVVGAPEASSVAESDARSPPPSRGGQPRIDFVR